jgi:hypothetical protein
MGTPVSRFCVGDGVDQVQVDDDGCIWIAFNDHGIMGDFGQHGWGRLTPEDWIDPVGVCGIVRYAASGEPEWTFDPPPGASLMGDCYALNVASSGAWTCYHPGFPLVRIEARGISMRETGLHGIDAITINDDRVLFYRSYGRWPGRSWLGRLMAREVQDIEPVSLELDDGGPLRSLRWVTGRNSSLHGFTDQSWYRFDMTELHA